MVAALVATTLRAALSENIRFFPDEDAKWENATRETTTMHAYVSLRFRGRRPLHVYNINRESGVSF